MAEPTDEQTYAAFQVIARAQREAAEATGDQGEEPLPPRFVNTPETLEAMTLLTDAGMMEPIGEPENETAQWRATARGREALERFTRNSVDWAAVAAPALDAEHRKRAMGL